MSGPLKFVEHEIEDNVIVTNKKPNDTNRQTVLLGAEKVVVGVSTNEQVIKVNPVTGLNYLANRVDAQEIYNSRKQVHSKWFVLDLETGERGWYPGSKLVATTLGSVEVKEDMSESSATVITLTNETVDITWEGYDEAKVKWNKIKFNETEGYVKSNSLINIRYVDRD